MSSYLLQSPAKRRGAWFNLTDISSDAIMRLRLISDVLARGFARLSRWINLFASPENPNLLRTLPVIGLVLSVSSLCVRSFQKFLQKEVPPAVKAFYIFVLLSLAALNLTNFAVTGAFSFAVLAISTVATRLFVDLIDAAISQVKYLTLAKAFKTTDLIFQLNLPRLKNLKEERATLTCKLALLTLCLKDKPDSTVVAKAIELSGEKLTLCKKEIDALELTFLEKQETLQKAKAARDTSFRMSSFSALCLLFLSLPLLAAIINPGIALSLLIAFELFECLAISNIAFRLYKAYHPAPSAKERYQKGADNDESALQVSSKKIYDSLNGDDLLKDEALESAIEHAKDDKKAKEEQRLRQETANSNQKGYFFFFTSTSVPNERAEDTAKNQKFTKFKSF